MFNEEPMSNTLSPRAAELRDAISAFIKERSTGALKDASIIDPDKRCRIWMDDAVKRVRPSKTSKGLQMVTHTVKGIHPGAKGTSLYRSPSSMPSLQVVGSHALGGHFDGDVIGNANILDVYKFLKLSHDGRTLLQLSLDRDPDLGSALSDVPSEAETWMAAFAGICDARENPASHTLAKQVYWLVGEDPLNDAEYHLLAPLFPSSLVHRVFKTINEDKFGEAAKAARQAMADGQFSEDTVRRYPQLAKQKLGGSNPQNAGQLFAERHGDSYLLASLPPVWKPSDVASPLRVDSIFEHFKHRTEVKRIVRDLLGFLKSDPRKNIDTRNLRDGLVEKLVDELLQFAGSLQTLEPGWSQHADCRLSAEEKIWLDPDGVEDAAGLDIPEAISESFAVWLNHQLRDPLPMGAPEYEHWCSLAETQLREI